jgi:hypothetical protein
MTLGYTEVIPLGIIDNPHTNQPVVLSEVVTVCPCCRNINSLRQAGLHVQCIECGWHPPYKEMVRAA